MGTVVRTMMVCMGIPFPSCSPWRNGTPPRVWARVATESTADEPAELPTEVKEVMAMFVMRSSNINDSLRVMLRLVYAFKSVSHLSHCI